ncbi:MAG: hypothetical protein CMJ77_01810 [Planctomycetaceae bacterium]|nr:hypothetical protein [Planctomycetaceae bacterium]
MSQFIGDRRPRVEAPIDDGSLDLTFSLFMKTQWRTDRRIDPRSSRKLSASIQKAMNILFKFSFLAFRSCWARLALGRKTFVVSRLVRRVSSIPFD